MLFLIRIHGVALGVVGVRCVERTKIKVCIADGLQTVFLCLDIKKLLMC